MSKKFIVEPNDFKPNAKFLQKTFYVEENVAKRLADFIEKQSNVYSKKGIMSKLLKEILDEYEE